MKIDVLTLFPSMYDNFINESIIKRAIEKKQVEINIHNIRDYTVYKNNQVDDYPFGGGGGMVLMCDPIFRAIDALKKENTLVIMMTPSGKVYKQSIAYNLSKHKHIIILCGHYEGFDERIKTIVDLELSIGDYILTGGELPSMVVMDSIIRLVDNVISSESLESESFDNNLLDYPNYTKPVEYRGMKVPDVLLSGHHENINKYRYEEQLRLTKENRPDLLGGMNNYFISKDNKSGEIVYLEYDKEGYKVTPKRKKEDAIEVNKIVFVSPKLTEKLIKKKIDHKLDKLLYELNLINIDDEDNDSGNSEKIRDMLKEAEKFRLSIINNYKKYLGNSYITLTLKKMQIIIDGYKAKLYTIKERENEKILINMFNQMKIEEPEKKGKGR